MSFQCSFDFFPVGAGGGGGGRAKWRTLIARYTARRRPICYRLSGIVTGLTVMKSSAGFIVNGPAGVNLPIKGTADSCVQSAAVRVRSVNRGYRQVAQIADR